MEYCDKELVEQLLRKEKNAFDRLYERYKSEVYRTAVLLTGNTEDAKDVMQDTFVTVSMNIHKLKDVAAFEGWMYRILARHAVHCIQNRRHEVLMEEVPQKPAAEEEVSELLCKEESRQHVWNYLSRMSERDRTVLILFYFNEFSVAEIADILGWNTGTVKSRLHYARKELEKIVRREAAR